MRHYEAGFSRGGAVVVGTVAVERIRDRVCCTFIHPDGKLTHINSMEYTTWRHNPNLATRLLRGRGVTWRRTVSEEERIRRNGH